VAAEIGGLHDRRRHDLTGRALENRLAEVEDVNVLAHSGHESHVVLDEQNPDAVLIDDAAQSISEPRCLYPIETRGRLVEQEYPRRPG
jgi:hypothetical protein